MSRKVAMGTSLTLIFAILASVTVGLLLDRGITRREIYEQPVEVVAVLPQVKEEFLIEIISMEVNQGHTLVTFSNGLKAMVADNAEGRVILKVGRRFNVWYFLTEGLPVIFKITPGITPPSCGCSDVAS